MNKIKHELEPKWVNENFKMLAQEPELRKRGQTIATRCGKDALDDYNSSYSKSNNLKCSPNLHSELSNMTATTVTTMASTLTMAGVNSNRNRSLSESSVDEIFRSGEATKQTGGNNKMWRNESGNTKIQPQHTRNDCGTADNALVDDVDGYCCCFGGGTRKNRISDAVDVGIRVTLVFIFIILESTKSFKRKIHKEEMWLYMNPRTPDIVSPAVLLVSVILGPFFVTLLLLFLTGDRRDFRASSWVWTLALCLNGLVTSTLKITVGRHRPDFFYRCFPDGVVVLNNITDSTGQWDNFNCTGNINDIIEGRKSFPSGHSSFAFVGFGFIAFLISAKLHACSSRGRGQSWRLCISITPLFIAALIAVSRTCDYHHHWEDVVIGGFIGIFITYLVYRQYYPSIFSRNCHRPYMRSCRGHLGKCTSTNSENQQTLSESTDGEHGSIQSSNGFRRGKHFKDYETASKYERKPLIYDS